MKTISKLLALGAVGTLTASAVRRVMPAWAARTRQLERVAPGLRSRALYLQTSVDGDRKLRMARRLLSRPGPLRPGVAVRETIAQMPGGDPVRVLLYERPERVRPSGALVWIHGGGFVMGVPEGDHEFCSRVADELDVLVLNVDYRLAPEHPFPAGLDDCLVALDWLHDRCDELGLDPNRFAVGGASAGAGLAASVAQAVHDRGRPTLALQLLQYPMLDDRTATREPSPDGDALVWSSRSNRFAWAAYLGHEPGEPEDRPYAVPARRHKMRGLPPAFICVGDIDLFHDEDVLYARRLAAAEVPCEVHVVPGMFHAADMMVPDDPAMVEVRRRMIGALRGAEAGGA
ncbi:MAG: alpha/beta hydrolase [Ilumatobacteraceae bacterium]